MPFDIRIITEADYKLKEEEDTERKRKEKRKEKTKNDEPMGESRNNDEPMEESTKGDKPMENWIGNRDFLPGGNFPPGAIFVGNSLRLNVTRTKPKKGYISTLLCAASHRCEGYNCESLQSISIPFEYSYGERKEKKIHILITPSLFVVLKKIKQGDEITINYGAGLVEFGSDYRQGDKATRRHPRNIKEGYEVLCACPDCESKAKDRKSIILVTPPPFGTTKKVDKKDVHQGLSMTPLMRLVGDMLYQRWLSEWLRDTEKSAPSRLQREISYILTIREAATILDIFHSKRSDSGVVGADLVDKPDHLFLNHSLGPSDSTNGSVSSPPTESSNGSPPMDDTGSLPMGDAGESVGDAGSLPMYDAGSLPMYDAGSLSMGDAGSLRMGDARSLSMGDARRNGLFASPAAGSNSAHQMGESSDIDDSGGDWADNFMGHQPDTLLGSDDEDVRLSHGTLYAP